MVENIIFMAFGVVCRGAERRPLCDFDARYRRFNARGSVLSPPLPSTAAEEGLTASLHAYTCQDRAIFQRTSWRHDIRQIWLRSLQPLR